MLDLALLRDLLIVDPAPAMAGDLVAELHERAREFGMPLDRHADAEHGQRQPALLKLAQNAPDARTRAVLIDRLHARVSRRIGRDADDFGKELLGRGIAMQNAVLPAFFIVEDELNSHTRFAGPVSLNGMSAVADEIAWVSRIEWHSER
jgi:hypothetical protein